MRADGRKAGELRPLEVKTDFLEQPHGSVLYGQGKTLVLCTATVEEGVPRWLARSGRGWMTAEYSMLPASTGERTQRAVSRGRPDGRTVEIQRLIGRALRSVCDFEALGERTLWLDCDVLQADGGTRCASITGVWIAARRALDHFGLSKALRGSVAAVSVGIVDGEAVLDLDYPEDSSAETDMNVVMTGEGAARRGAGDGGAGSVLARAPRSAARPRGGRYRGPHGRPGRRRSRSARVKLILASRNEHKLREWRDALPEWAIAPSTAIDPPAEDGTTFVDNARIKARHARDASPDEAWVAGEDSGIEVSALGGGPGIESARWAAEPVVKLLAELQGVEERGARYVCEVVALDRDGIEIRASGTLEGTIAHEPSGTGGFGYDPIFVPRGESLTVALLGDPWKAAHSHRAQAARALAALLR